MCLRGIPHGTSGKKFTCQCRRLKRHVQSIPGSERWLGVGNGNPLVFLPGKFNGQRSLVGYSPWGRRESDCTEQLSSQIQLDIGCLHKRRYIYRHILEGLLSRFSHVRFFATPWTVALQAPLSNSPGVDCHSQCPCFVSREFPAAVMPQQW